MRCASLAAAAAVVVVNIFPDDDDDDDDLTPKHPPRSSHKEEEEDKEIARRHAVALKEEDEEDLLPKREAASFREMNICVCFCVVLSCVCVGFPKGKILFFCRSFKERLYIERESVASSSPTSLLSRRVLRRGEEEAFVGFFRALAGHAREREELHK